MCPMKPRFMSRALSKMMSPFITENNVRNPFSKFLNFSVSSAKRATPKVVNPIKSGALPTANCKTTGKPRLIALNATSYGGIVVVCLPKDAHIKKHPNPFKPLAKFRPNPKPSCGKICQEMEATHPTNKTAFANVSKAIDRLNSECETIRDKRILFSPSVFFFSLNFDFTTATCVNEIKLNKKQSSNTVLTLLKLSPPTWFPPIKISICTLPPLLSKL